MSLAEDDRKKKTVAAVLFAVVALCITYASWEFDNDDAYITYRYALHLSHGKGLVYNEGERVLGTTTPLYALLLGFLTAVFGGMPHVWGKLISGLCLAIVGFEVAMLSCQESNERTASLLGWPIAIGALVMLDPILISGGFGAETYLHIALILGAILAVGSRRDVTAGLLAGLAITCRGDGIIIAAVVVAALFHLEKRLPFGTMAGFLVIVGLWGVFAWVYYGSPIPETLQAKRLQAVALDVDFWKGIPYYARRYTQQAPALVLMLPVALLGLHQMLRSRRVTHIMLVIWAAAYMIGYSILNVPYIYIWYFSVISPAIIVAMGIGILWIWSRRKRLWRAFAVVAVVLIGWSFMRCDMGFWRWLPYPRHPVYVEMAEWLKENATPDESIAAFEVGALGYYSERKIIDLWGLVTPHVAERTIADGDETWAVRHYRPTYLVFHRDAWGNEQVIRDAEWFDRAYQYLRSFESGRYEGVDVYRLTDEH